MSDPSSPPADPQTSPTGQTSSGPISGVRRRQLREADFWTSLIFLTFSAAMLFGALQMPMRESYGGVRNAWYVSPALLPLIVAGGLILLSTALLTNAIRTGGAQRALVKIRWRPYSPSTSQRRAFLAALLIAAYVYALLPRVDFVVATALFLLAFIGGYYPDDQRATRNLPLAFLGFAAVVGIAGAFGFRPVRGEIAGLLVDSAGILLFISVAVLSLRRCPISLDRKRLRTAIIVAIVVPFVLGPIFKFALLVPLPTEGAVIQVVEEGVYLLRPDKK